MAAKLNGREKSEDIPVGLVQSSFRENDLAERKKRKKERGKRKKEKGRKKYKGGRCK